MLAKCGAGSLEDLYVDVPRELLLKDGYDIPEAKSETELRQHFENLAGENTRLTVFAGGGVYDHYSPAVVPQIIQRSEYLTSYTPYQAEISQGTLHYIFEYQTMMCRLTGMDVSNASMYDGSTATAEAAMMAFNNVKKADRVMVSATVDEKILNVVKTYARYHGFDIDVVAEKDGVTDVAAFESDMARGGSAGMIVQQPNKYGIIEDFGGMADKCHEQKALFIVNSVAADLAILKTPAEWGADVAVGEAQSLGLPMCFGGPYLGYMCCTEKLVRKMPGRIVGQTVDSRGQRAFVLTLQAREQHIRRQKATSNICSNESLMALYVTVYMSLMGREGLKEAAELSYAGAHYLCDKLTATGHFTKVYDKPFFNEFCVRYDGDAEALQKRLLGEGIMAGLHLGGNVIMFAVTEKRTKEEIDKLVNLIES